MPDTMIFFRMIRDFLEVYLPKQKGASKLTIKSYKATINQYLDYIVKYLNIELKNIDFSITKTSLIEEFLIHGENNLKWSISTRNQKLSALKSFYKYASNHDYSLMIYYKEISIIPLKHDIKNKGIDYFSEEELELLLTQPNINNKKEFRNLVIMILLYDSGARIQELLDLKIKDLFLNEATPYVILTGKGSKMRIVPLMEKTVKQLEKYLRVFHHENDSSDYLFYTIHNGKHTIMSQDMVQKFIDKYCKTAKSQNNNMIDHIYCHMFRHSRATHLYRNGMPLPLVSEWLGHKQINTTREFYAQSNLEMKKEAIDTATANLNISIKDGLNFDFENDDELLKRLYGLK